jgi:hypothetical protein
MTLKGLLALDVLRLTMCTNKPSGDLITMSCDVFLSYTREKHCEELWRQLQTELQLKAGRSVTIFKDTEAIRTGDNWRKVLSDELESAKIFLFLLSVPWIQSKECIQEYKIFKKTMTNKKTMFPIEWVPVDDAFLEPGQRILNKEIQQLNRRFSWADLRHRSMDSYEVKSTIANMANELAADLKLARAP